MKETSEEAKAIREEASKTRRLIIGICLIVAVVAMLFVGRQEAKETQARIDSGVESIMDQVAP